MWVDCRSVIIHGAATVLTTRHADTRTSLTITAPATGHSGEVDELVPYGELRVRKLPYERQR